MRTRNNNDNELLTNVVDADESLCDEIISYPEIVVDNVHVLD